MLITRQRSRTTFYGLALAVLSTYVPHAFAQNIDALEDQVLSGASPATSPPANDPAPAAPSYTPPPPVTDTSDDYAAPPPPPRKSEVEVPADKRDDVNEELKSVDRDVQGPDRIPLDHILVVQYRFIRKEGTHEITPFYAGLQPADSFRRQMPWGFAYGYHFSEDFGVEALNVSFVKNFNTGLADSVTKTYNKLYVERKEPVFSLGTAILWTPLKSKAATHDEIHYFEGYFLGGGGLVRYENEMVAMAQVGLGFRAYMTQRALFKAEIRDHFDFVGSAQQRLNFLFGVSLLLGGGE